MYLSVKFIVDQLNEIVSGFVFTVTITPNSGETFRGFLLKAVEQGQTDAVGSFDTSSDTVQARCGEGQFRDF